MTARLLRFFLACELAFYLLGGFMLVRSYGWSSGKAVTVALLLALAGRAFVTGLTYLFALTFSSPRLPRYRIGFGRALRMALAEYLGFVLLFSLIQPFERLFMGRDRLSPPQAGRLPVLLIHGYECNRGFWFWLRRRLERAGWTVATINLEPVFGSIDAYAQPVADRIGEICAATGATQVILVGHSMGGLVARAYLRRFGNERVAKLIMLGSPHHGSVLATLGFGENGRQMRPGSAWLDALNAPVAVPLPAAAISIYSCHDNYVMPQASSVLEGATNIPLAGIGHLQMAFAPEIVQAVLEELQRVGAVAA